jgi:hypothetical protein
MFSVLKRDELRTHSFWWFQTVGWCYIADMLGRGAEYDALLLAKVQAEQSTEQSIEPSGWVN